MYNIPELYFLSEPVETPIGNFRFFKVKEYWKAMQYGEMLTINRTDLLEKAYVNIPENIVDEMLDKDLLKIIRSYDNIFKLNTAFNELFNNLVEKDSIKIEIDNLNKLKEEYIKNIKKCTTKIEVENVGKSINMIQERIRYLNLSPFDKITNMEEFDYYRKLIKDMNHIIFEKPNSNKELAYYDKMAQIIKEKNGEIVTFKSMVRSVGLHRLDVLEISIDSLYMYFDGIMYDKNYDRQVLYSSVPSEKPYKITTYWFTDGSLKKTKLNEEDKEMIDNHMGTVQEDHSKDGIVGQI